MWALLLVMVLLQVLTLVLVGHPITHEFIMDILDCGFWILAQVSRKFGLACLTMATAIRGHESMDRFRLAEDDDSDKDDDDDPPPPPPPAPPSAGAGASTCCTKTPASIVRSRARTPGPHSRNL